MTVLTHQQLAAPLVSGWWKPGDVLLSDPGQLDFPYRIVDAGFQGWLHMGGDTYQCDFLRHPSASYADIDAGSGPLRHVIQMPEHDRLEMMLWLGRAQDQAISCVLRAVHTVLAGRPERTHELIAGREGSWESQGLRDLAFKIGEDLPVAPDRPLDSFATAAIAEVIERWITGYPCFYVEVAASVNSLLAQAARVGYGWRTLVDARWLPGAGEHPYAGMVRAQFGYQDET